MSTMEAYFKGKKDLFKGLALENLEKDWVEYPILHLDLNGMQDIINRPVPLFFQTGYLTIKDYDNEFQEYTLGFPNDEVKNGFLNFIYSYRE